MSDVDVFDGIVDSSPSVEVSAEEPETSETSETETSEETPETETEDKPIETVSKKPEGAVSVTEFAKNITQKMMAAVYGPGGTGELKGDEFVVPQAVYQTVKAARDRIPHVLVLDEGDKEPRAYILEEEATTWWLARRERLQTRGSGTGTRASNRTAEDNLVLLGGAVGKALYAKARLAMWQARVEQSDKLVEKYQGFLKDQSVDEETILLAIQDATNEFETEQKAKADEKAKAKSKPSDDADNE